MKGHNACVVSFRFFFFIVILPLLLSCAPEYPKTVTDSIQGRTSTIKKLDPAEALALIHQNRGNASFFIIDIRTPEEFASYHIKDAININYYGESFVGDLDRLDKGKSYLVYCRTGRRTSETVGIMVQLGFTSIYRINGDIVRWKSEGLPVVKP